MMKAKIHNYVGMTFDRLTVVSRDLSSSRTKWNCQCSCGNSCSVQAAHLKSKKIRSCGCLSKELLAERSFKDLVGQTFGKLTVLSKYGTVSSDKIAWLCLCSCGKTVVVRGNSLVSGNTRSCNCSTSLEAFIEQKLNINKCTEPPLRLPKRKPDFKIADGVYLEADGLYWHIESNRDAKMYHFEKRLQYEAQQYRLLQFYEDEVFDQWPIVESIINNAIFKNQNRIFARKTEIRSVTNKTACSFFKENHLMGHHKASKSIGLYFDDELVACLAFRKTSKGLMEIARFAGLKNTIIVGGFSKLLKELEKICQNEKIFKIVSFCDMRYATGKSYILNGFSLEGVSLGWSWTDNKNRFNRLKCKAGNGKTELENAKELGWNKIYDAGQAKFVKNLI